MTEQVRLSGDASNDAGLDDSIAFSQYTEAIDRISDQYSRWKKAQDEFRNYQEMYRTAEGLARSIGYDIQDTLEFRQEVVCSLPKTSVAQNILEESINLTRQIENLKKHSSIEKKKYELLVQEILIEQDKKIPEIDKLIKDHEIASTIRVKKELDKIDDTNLKIQKNRVRFKEV